MIYLRNGAVIDDNRKADTILKNVARCYGADLSALRRNYGKKFGSCHNVPLPFGMSMVMVPVKTRKPLTQKDGATAYINLCAVKNLTTPENGEEGGPVKCYLLLEGDHKLPSLHSIKNTENRLNKGHCVSEHYYLLHLTSPENNVSDPLEFAARKLRESLDISDGLYFKLLTAKDLLKH